MDTELSYRDVLRIELETRLARNSRYSLRAFARHLGLSSGRLSEILAGKQNISAEWADRIADALKWTDSKRAHFRALVDASQKRSRQRKEVAIKWLTLHGAGATGDTAKKDTISIQLTHAQVKDLLLFLGYPTEFLTAIATGVENESFALEIKKSDQGEPPTQE
jgi:plasmid maintenance system antidote protein VapI